MCSKEGGHHGKTPMHRFWDSRGNVGDVIKRQLESDIKVLEKDLSNLEEATVNAGIYY